MPHEPMLLAHSSAARPHTSRAYSACTCAWAVNNLHMHVVAAGAGGLPIGAVLLKQHVADVMSPGDHGSTFAGNPLVCAAANTTFDIIADAGFLEDVERKGERLRAALRDACGDNPHVKVRSYAAGSGL